MLLDDLLEGRSGELYHFTSLNKIREIVEGDALVGRWIHYIPQLDREVQGTSLTRNKNLNKQINSNFALVLDQQKLASRYKIYPLNGDRIFFLTRAKQRQSDRQRDYSQEDRAADKSLDRVHDRKLTQPFAEEFLPGTVKELHRYLIEIHSLQAPIDSLIRYCEKFKIPLKRMEKF